MSSQCSVQTSLSTAGATSFGYGAQTSLIAATLVWGLAPVFVESALNYLPPLKVVTYRFGLASLILLLTVFLIRGRKGFSLLSNRVCILLGSLDAFVYLAAVIGQDMTTAGLATLLSTCYLVVVPFYEWKLGGNKPSMKIGVFAAVAMIGASLVAFNGDWANFSSLSVLGILASIVAALLCGLYIAIGGKFLQESAEEENRKIHPLDYLATTTFYTFLPLILLSLLTDKTPILPPLEVIPALLFLAIFATIIAFGLYNWAIPRIGAVRTSFYLLLQVIIPFAFELLFWGQYYSLWVYAGVAIIFAVLLFI
ncbi:MAG: DMT family transporter [Candidatus Odinarchaeota archaeon]